MWLLLAFSGPVCWAVSTHIDKYLVDRYFQDSDTAVLMLFTALVGMALLPFIWWFEPAILAPAPMAIAVMTASGILYMGAMLFYLRAIQSEEASVVAPLFQASTLFTFLLGYLFLRERLSASSANGRRHDRRGGPGIVAPARGENAPLQDAAYPADAGGDFRAGAVHGAVQVLRHTRRFLDHDILDFCRRRPVRDSFLFCDRTIGASSSPCSGAIPAR